MRRRISSICKWTLTVLLTLVLSLEIASVWWTFHWQRGPYFAASQVRMSAIRGKFELFWRREELSPWNPTPLQIVPRGLSVRRADNYLYWVRPGRPPPFTWAACEFRLPRNGSSAGLISFPLAWAVLALALPTAWLWLGDFRRRKKARAGCCRTCGYDLRGLEQANKKNQPHQPTRCPECGEPAATA